MPSYNICKTAGSTLGRMHQEESKIKIGLYKKGKTGFIRTAQARTEETKEKISKSMLDGLKGENHPMYGKTLAEGTKEKMRISKLGENHPGSPPLSFYPYLYPAEIYSGIKIRTDWEPRGRVKSVPPGRKSTKLRYQLHN